MPVSGHESTIDRLMEQKYRLELERIELLRKTSELSFMNEFSQEITSSLSCRRIIQILFDRLGFVGRARFFSLFILQDERVQLFHASSGRQRQADLKRSIGEFLRGADKFVGRAVSIEDIVEIEMGSCEGKFEPELQRGNGHNRARLEFPLSAGGTGMGVAIAYDVVSMGLCEDVTKAMDAMIGQAAQALTNAMEHVKMKEMALKDGLTDAFNYRGLQDILERNFAERCRYGKEISFIMLDIDHFKKVNDAFGHQTGDNVLRALSRLISRFCRRSDCLARYGGEEFALVLPGTDVARAIMMAERIRSTVEGYCLINSDKNVRVTVSLGVSGTSVQGVEDVNDLIRTADGALYCAKQEGRNRVRVAGGDGMMSDAMIEPNEEMAPATMWEGSRAYPVAAS